MINIKKITLVKKLKYNENLYAYNVVADEVIYTVPIDEANTDYQNILKWVEDGNTIQEAD